MTLLRRWLAWKVLRLVLLAGVVLFGVAQAIPYGRDHANPPVRTAITWDSPATQRLARAACLDCHSNLTVWPWYSSIAPISWLVQHDVADGRGELNLNELDLRAARGGREGGGLQAEIAEKVLSGEMPPLQYQAVHAGARLSAAERKQLADGLRRTLQAMGVS